MVIGGSLCANALYRMLPVCCPRPKGKGVLTGVSPCQNTLAHGSPDWTRTCTATRRSWGFLEHLPRVALPAASGDRLSRQRRLRRRNRAQRGSRIGGGAARTRKGL